MNTEALYSDAVALLRDLIRIPSPSREEAGTACDTAVLHY